ncbi:MAG TPA: DUF1028 domain-containing protein [Anaerolineales bacterium]|nr:DUF1028 domain-containing protein [Anaerolineales bacterium]
MNRFSTFSIVAYDAVMDAWGIAVASKFLAVGAVVPWAQAGAGAVATQSYANTTFGPKGLELMSKGESAQEVLNDLLANDEERELRQVGIVDAQGRSATFTGADCFEWAGGKIGANYCVQGNLLTGPEVIDQMASTFEGSKKDLPERMLDSLLAADQAGGDRRGKQSAAIYVVKPEGGYAGFNDHWIDYRIDDHEDPVPRLMEILRLHNLYFGKSPAEEEIEITGAVCEALQQIMQDQGYDLEEITGEYDQETQTALRQFIGNENFEERAEFEKGRIDRPVYEYLLKKFRS